MRDINPRALVFVATESGKWYLYQFVRTFEGNKERNKIAYNIPNYRTARYIANCLNRDVMLWVSNSLGDKHE